MGGSELPAKGAGRLALNQSITLHRDEARLSPLFVRRSPFKHPMDPILDDHRAALLRDTRHTLGQLRDTLADAGADPVDREALADSLRQLDELFLLVIAGEFNAGKSAFINALLGQQLLKEGATPTTAQIHLLQYGDELGQVPAKKGMLLVTAPLPLLENINIVDTPGTNAILREHEAITADFIPRSDLVLFLTSADRPFTESERAFLSRIKAWGKKIVLVVNKIDILESPEDVQQVIDFVTEAGQKLVGDIAAVFPVSARRAQKAKQGQPQLWIESGFEPLEQYIERTLDDTGRFRLKLLNPLGVGQKVVQSQLADCRAALSDLSVDRQLLADIHQQTTYYNADMQRNFQARLSEIGNLVYEMEKRGDAFFDETIRLGRVFDLVRSERIKQDYVRDVVADAPKQIERRVDELIDWLVEQDLRQWTSVSDHLDQRRRANDDRIVGQTGPREGTLAYDRQRLIDSIGKDTEHAINTYDREHEATRLANGARDAVAGAAIAGIGSLGVGALIVAGASTIMWDVTGVVAGLAGVTLGLFILPARRRKAKQELSEKLAELREKLVGSLTQQFEREMRRSAQRIDDAVSPFSRFVRAQHEKLESQQSDLQQVQEEIAALRGQLEKL